MPHPNRVTPFGAFEATPHRGTLMGNRGILHDAQGRIGAARWRHPHWICCALTYKGWHREILQPGRWTELFFLDEATALAAGHRPCALCRRTAYNAYREAWRTAFHLERPPSAAEMDRALHAARLKPGSRAQRLHAAKLEALPDGAMIALDDRAWLVLGERLLAWSHAGYEETRPRGEGPVMSITPAPTLACLAAGYRARVHESAET